MDTFRRPDRWLRRKNVDIWRVLGTSRSHYYLTARADGSGDPYSALAAVLAEYGIQSIQEQILGLVSAKDGLLAQRKAAFTEHGLNPELPFCHVEGRPTVAGPWAGVQIWGVGPGSENRPADIATVDCPGGTRGRLWSTGGSRLLYVPAVTGAEDGASATDQARRMFADARTALQAHGFPYSNVVRTWIYMRRLRDWYEDFNKVRNALYCDPAFYGAPADDRFPASTGIQGRCTDEECVMNLLALDAGRADDASVRPILRSARQGQASAYHSAFSRAAVLRLDGLETIYVSGTASINDAGNSVYLGDRDAQAFQTLMSIASLLDEQGARLDDVCAATLYCADIEALQAYRRMERLLGLPTLPFVAVLADVCRKELFIEMEVTAVVKPAAAGHRTFGAGKIPEVPE